MADLELDGVNSKAKINKIESDTGSTVTLGQSGDTVTLGSGATLGSVFDPSQTVTWSSTIITTNTTLASGNGYFVDTTSGAITVTLPASPSVGDYLQIKDYAGTFATNNLTIARNGENIQGVANDSLVQTNRAALKLVYADATKGWLYVEESNVGDLQKIGFVAATGGTITTSGDFKIHTFNSSGTFTVTDAGNPLGSNTVDYLVVAGGGGGGSSQSAGARGAGGAGAGGYRESFPNPATGGTPISAQAYPITVGGGGSAGSSGADGASGSNSIFSTITSAGGGGGGGTTNSSGVSGGSGGGATSDGSGGSGNTPSVSPPQGNNGGQRSGGLNVGSAGGGGASAVGGNFTVPGTNGAADSGSGGAGTASTITASPVTRAGGGGGGACGDAFTDQGAGGAGGGGRGATLGGSAGVSGTANTGGAGGGAADTSSGPGNNGGAGGAGVVIIRYKFQ